MRVQKFLLVGLLSVAVTVFAACGEDPVDDGDGDDIDGVRILGTLSVQEGSYLANQSAKVNASFKLEQPTCGVDVRPFGQCSITTKTQVTCTPNCTAGKVCAWKADCSGGECVDSVALHAGEITITGATYQDPLTCSYNTTLQPPKYECDVTPSGAKVFDPGDVLTIVAPGDDFPAFSQTVIAPPLHSFDPDLVGLWTTDDFDGAADVSVTWTIDETADEYKLTVLTTDPGDSLVCHFSDSGSFDIPQAGIAALGSPVVQVDIHRQNASVFDEGDHELTIKTVEGLAIAVEGACLTCARYVQSCQTACPEIDNVCDGPARDDADDLNTCLCAECPMCEVACGTGTTDPATCKTCKQPAMNGACSTQRSTCQSN